MQELAAGQDTQNSCPVGICGFGLGATDQARAEAAAGTEAFAGTEALAGIPAAPARATPTRRAELAAIGLILNFIVTPILQSQFAGPWAMLGGRKAENGAVPLPEWEG